MSRFATGLRLLDLAIFPLEPPSLFFGGHGLLHEVVRSVFLVDSRAKELGWAFNDRSCLGKRWNLALSVVFLVMSVGIENRSHLDELKIALQLRS